MAGTAMPRSHRVTGVSPVTAWRYEVARHLSRLLRVLRAFAVKVQPRIHREAAKSAKSARISRRKLLSCQQRIFGLVVQDRSSFVTWPGRPCHDAIVARASRRG